MKIALISDIHSNWEALKEVLSYLRKVQCSSVICCGDVTGYGANPNECLKELRQIKNLKIVLGNHDAGVLDKTPLTDFNDLAREAILWTKREISEENLRFLSSLPLFTNFRSFYVCHSSPQSPERWHYIFSFEEAKYQFRFFTKPICVIGHTHIPFAVEKNQDGYRIIREMEFKIEKNSKYLINVGSVGQPRDSDPRATFALYDTKRNLFQFIKLPYDIKTQAQKIVSAGLPKYLAERLFLGR
jgi:putative phosphoesterase